MTKLGADIRLAALGATAGFFSISVFLLIARVDAYYVYLSSAPDEFTYGRVEDLWWLPFLAWHVILSSVASLVAHRYLPNSRPSPFLLWQAIGFMVLVGWVLTFLLAGGIGVVMHGNLDALEVELRRIEPSFFGKYISAAFASNVLYGSVIQTSARHYQDAQQNEAADADPALER